MVPIPNEFNYIAPKITAKLKKPSTKNQAKNISMQAPSRYGQEKNTLKDDYIDMRGKP